MPIFDFECKNCGTAQEDVFVHSIVKEGDYPKCSKCQMTMTRKFPVNSRFHPKIFPADGIFLEHVSREGKRFFSEREMRDFEKKNNVELGALL